MLPPLIGRQKEVVALPARGHTVVLGSAGSGKTTLAIYRAGFLADPTTPSGGRTLLLTFNKALVAYLRHLRDPVRLPGLGRVTAEHYHKFARGYLRSRGIMGQYIYKPSPKFALIRQAIDEISAGKAWHAVHQQAVGFYADEIAWIERQGLMTLDDYVNQPGADSSASQRDADSRTIYSVYEAYRRIRDSYGYLCDYDDIATLVKDHLETDPSSRMYRHVVIDEGQDFSPEMIRSLAIAVPPDGSLTLFGDMAQQIYGQRISWRSAGLHIKEPWIFRENYRNTLQIANLALAIAGMPYYAGVPDLVRPTNPTAPGEPPTIVRLRSRDEEIKFVARLLAASAGSRSVAVLTRKRDDARLIQAMLGKFGKRATVLWNSPAVWPAGAGAFVGTYHSAKGLEFDMVLLPFLSSEIMPDRDVVLTVGEEEALARDGKLLYVAVTRARYQLMMTYTDRPTELLPKDSRLYAARSI